VTPQRLFLFVKIQSATAATRIMTTIPMKKEELSGMMASLRGAAPDERLGWLLADLAAVIAVLVALFPAPLGGEPQAWGKIRRGFAGDAGRDAGGCAGCSGQANSRRQHRRQQKHSHWDGSLAAIMSGIQPIVR
jgi:hypothetical protein